ncbi:hypothetical protein LJR289_001435 [Pseudoduganella sp. LjRoot289]|uniref:hypothetical protein n=1 Tax=Pseudoduganella sp. LjRoot289 TaxID=3342314 RepID=UPI003ECFCD29
MNRLLEYLPEVEIPPPPGTPPTSLSLEAPETDLEMVYAAELLEASAANGAGLPPFIAGMIARSGPAGRSALRLPLGRALMGTLLQVARRLLPFGSRAAQLRAATIFGLELEGLSPEDKEFALARHFVRLAQDVIGGALAAGVPARGQDAGGQVQAALAQAARRHAPGLLHRVARQEPAGGRWQRSGKRIVVLNC